MKHDDISFLAKRVPHCEDNEFYARWEYYFHVKWVLLVMLGILLQPLCLLSSPIGNYYSFNAGTCSYVATELSWMLNESMGARFTGRYLHLCFTQWLFLLILILISLTLVAYSYFAILEYIYRKKMIASLRPPTLKVTEVMVPRRRRTIHRVLRFFGDWLVVPSFISVLLVLVMAELNRMYLPRSIEVLLSINLGYYGKFSRFSYWQDLRYVVFFLVVSACIRARTMSRLKAVYSGENLRESKPVGLG